MISHVLLPYVKHYVIPKLLVPIVGKPVKVAVLVEMAAWTEQLRSLIGAGDNLFFSMTHPYNFTDHTAKIVYTSYPSPVATDFSVELQEIEDKGVQLIVHVFSEKAGQTFITQWGERKTPALPIGINVLAQESSHWDITEGKCNYEIAASTPLRVNVTEETIPFWDSYVARWGHNPIYTAFGAYDAVYALAEAVERAGTIDSDAVVAELQETDRISTSGRFKFTNYHDVFVEPTKDPPGNGAYWYTDPDKRDLPAEDIFYVTWLSSEYVTPLLVQWQNGERVIVFPFNQTYTTKIEFPPWMDGIPGRPIAGFTYSPESPLVGDTVTFNASTSNDPDGYIMSYEWDFGDGNTGTGMIVDHVYTAVDEYMVTLRVKDNDTRTDTTTKSIIPVAKPIFEVLWDDQTFNVSVEGNSTIIADFYFSQPMKQIGFKVTGPDDTIGFCNVTIPIELLGGTYTVLVNDWPVSPDPIWTWNDTHSFICFTYSHSINLVKIVGTTVIPEFTTALLLPLFLIFALIAVALTNRIRHGKQ